MQQGPEQPHQDRPPKVANVVITAAAAAKHHTTKRLRQVCSDIIVVPSRPSRSSNSQLIDDGAASSLPPFGIEISHGRSLEDAIENAKLYVERTQAHIRTIFILDFRFPDISSRHIQLFTTDIRAAGRPILHEVQSLTLFDLSDINTVEQSRDPAAGIASPRPGPLRLFASDFFSFDTDVPSRLKRSFPFEGHGDEYVMFLHSPCPHVFYLETMLTEFAQIRAGRDPLPESTRHLPQGSRKA